MLRSISLLFLLFQTSLSFAQLLPQPDHVVILIMENHDYSQIIGEPTIMPLRTQANPITYACFRAIAKA